MLSLNKIIIARTALILTVFGLVGFAAYARNDIPGITFATYGIDLKIDSRAWYNGTPVPGSTWALKNLNPTSDKFFNFNDIKPGDYGKDIISLHVGKSDAWMCIDFKNLQSKENGINEPESHVDVNQIGELAKGTEFFSWIDDGDGKYESNEKILFGNGQQSADAVLNDKTYTIGDSGGGNICKSNTTKYIGIMWCAGNLTVNTNTGAYTCDGTVLGNEAQTDSFTVDVIIRALSARENLKFLCKKKEEVKKLPTRTLGFWQTHTEFTSKIFASSTMQKYIGVNSAPVAGSHKGTITNTQLAGASQLFGAYYSSIPKKTDNSNRTTTDKNRMQLLQQLITAKLNCAMVICSATTLNLISDADNAYKLGSANMLTLSGQLDTYNNSGDSIPLPASLGSQGSATPGTSQSLADKVFWNAP